jgi:Tfp pilus assembly protein PilO
MFITTLRRLAGEIVPILVFSCAALGSLAAVRIAAVPQWRELSALSSETSRYTSFVSDRNRFQTITAQLLDKKEQLTRLSSRVAPDAHAGAEPADLSGVLQLLILRAKQADIRFVKMEPVGEVQRKGQEYPVVLEMTASYESLGRFVSSLEELPRTLSVDRLAITVQRNGLDVRILVTCFLGKAG